MAKQYKDITPAVTITDDRIILQIGPEGFEFDYAEIVKHAGGLGDGIETLKRNIGIYLSLTGVNLSDKQAVKTAKESRTFKY